jgi:mono/diheme cytochrome c family protein
MVLAAAAGLVLLLVFGGQLLALLAGRMAARQLDAWALGAAQRWLARAARLDPADSELDLMRAACYRRQGDSDSWIKALLSAERKGAPSGRIEEERQLVALGSGQLRTDAEDRFVALLEAGVPPQDVGTALLACYLDHNQFRKARLFLETWEAEYAGDPHVAYLWGLYWMKLEEFDRARDRCRAALAAEPRHELARGLLARLSEMRDRPDQALEQHLGSRARIPASGSPDVDLARVLRKLNHGSQARTLLTRWTSGPQPQSNAVLEMAQLEFESGNYREAQRWFAGANLEWRAEKLLPAAIAANLVGDAARAEYFFARYDAKVKAVVRTSDLQIRLSINPSDRQAADELQRLLSATFDEAIKRAPPETGPGGEDATGKASVSATELYAQKCAACHGANGDGRGHAARHLFPRPLDFRAGRFRLASTLNGVPTPEDLDTVVRQGIPGAAMPAFEDLSESQRRLLVGEVLRLYREGVRAEFIREASREGEELDEDQILEAVQQYATPGEVVRVPRIGPADSTAIERGKQAYFDLGCRHCHGDDGRGAPGISLLDDSGRPTRPRDLVYESFKGGQDAESVYRRIFAGMPGTPHPACRTVSEETLIDLVHYCRSLSRNPKLMLTNHQRAIRAGSAAYLAALHASQAP